MCVENKRGENNFLNEFAFIYLFNDFLNNQTKSFFFNNDYEKVRVSSFFLLYYLTARFHE